MNFTRNLERFYASGMNVCTKSEKKEKKEIHIDSREGQDKDSEPQAEEDSASQEWKYN